MSKQETLSPELEALFESSRPIQDLDLQGLAEAIRDLESSPTHVAETRKAVFVEDILRALDDDEVSKSELGRRMGKSRQQISTLLDEDKKNNFTIETMAKISVALGRKLIVRMLASETEIQLNRNTIVQTAPQAAQILKQPWEDTIGSVSRRSLKQGKKASEADTSDKDNILPFSLAA
jgi:plasmid maintenance system antidote protein VapI